MLASELDVQMTKIMTHLVGRPTCWRMVQYLDQEDDMHSERWMSSEATENCASYLGTVLVVAAIKAHSWE
jgi:hypothetical protein